MTTRFTVVTGQGAQVRTFRVDAIIAWGPNGTEPSDTTVLLLTSGDKVIVRGNYEDVDHTMTRCLEARR